MLFGFEAASRAAVAGEGFDGVVERTLHQRMELLVFQFFACDPLRGGDQRRLPLQVAQVPAARRSRRFSRVYFQCNDGLQYINGRRLRIVRL